MPLRLFLGVTFVYAGIQKLTDPQFFQPTAPGYIGRQILAFAHGSPLHDPLITVVVPHAIFFGGLVAYGELAIGLGTLLGLLLRPAAFFGLLLSLIFFLTASWHVFPYFYGADIVFVFCWLTLLLAGPQYSGYPALDVLLARKLLAVTAAHYRDIAKALCMLLIAAVFPTRNIQETAPVVRQQTKSKGTSLRVQQAGRRGFLRGMGVGGATVAGLALLWMLLFGGHGSILAGDNPGSVASTAQAGTSDNGQPAGMPGEGGEGENEGGAHRRRTAQPQPTQSSSGGTAAGQSMTIAQVSQVPPNSAYSFTIAATGGDGILVHLRNNQFVAFDAACTHAGCLVDYDPGSQYLVCPCHGAEFDPANGAAVIQGPTSTPLTPLKIQVDSATGAIILQ